MLRSEFVIRPPSLGGLLPLRALWTNRKDFTAGLLLNGNNPLDPQTTYSSFDFDWADQLSADRHYSFSERRIVCLGQRRTHLHQPCCRAKDSHQHAEVSAAS